MFLHAHLSYLYRHILFHCKSSSSTSSLPVFIITSLYQLLVYIITSLHKYSSTAKPSLGDCMLVGLACLIVGKITSNRWHLIWLLIAVLFGVRHVGWLDESDLVMWLVDELWKIVGTSVVRRLFCNYQSNCTLIKLNK